MYGNDFERMFGDFSRTPYGFYNDTAAIFGIAFVVFLFIMFVLAVLVVLILIGLFVGRWMLFTKAGQAGWKAIIPFYSEYVFIVDVCKCHWILFLLELLLFWNIPVLIFINTMINYNLGIKTHQSPTAFIWFTVFGVPLDSIMGLCRKSYEYNPDEPSSRFGFIGTKQ